MSMLRYVVVFVCFLMPSLATASQARRLTAEPVITAATVYPDRAMTTRTASFNLSPGSWLVVFDNLPVLVQDDSVRVDGKGSAGVVISGIEVKRHFLEQAAEKRAREIDEEIRALERRMGSLDAKKAGLSSQKSFIESIRVAWGDRISKELAIGRPTNAELLDASSFVGAGITKVEEQSRDIENEKRQTKDKIDALRRQREEVAGSRRKESKSVEVMLEVSREGDLKLELSSVTPQASWEPAYDVRLSRDGKQAELATRALIRQQTGEDWKDLSLTLSTARPAAGGAPPELNPWRISFYRPPPPMPAMAPAPYLSKAKKAARMMDAEEPEMMAKAEAVAEYQTAEVSGEQTSVVFRIPRTLDIPSDGSQHGTLIAVSQLPANLEFLAVPKLSSVAFLKSELVNKSAFPLLPGRVNTFIGTTFTGSSPLKKVAVGETFDLFFGGDDQVTLKREELRQHKEAGMFGANRMSYRYRIEVGNFRSTPQTIIVRDQLPLAGDAEIKVSLDDPSLKPDEVKNDGTLIWKLMLAAGEKRELTFGIVVEYPKERELTGL